MVETYFGSSLTPSCGSEVAAALGASRQSLQAWLVRCERAGLERPTQESLHCATAPAGRSDWGTSLTRASQIGWHRVGAEVRIRRIMRGVKWTAAACYLNGHRWRRIRRTGTHTLVCLRCDQLSTVEAQGHPESYYAFADAVDDTPTPYPPL